MFVPTLGNTFHESTHEIAFYHGERDIDLLVVTRFDGNGNARVFFRITDNEAHIDYEKFDAAASAYNTKLEAIDSARKTK